jgi:RecB family exonuclease
MRAPGLLADPAARDTELALVDSLELHARRTGARSAAAGRRLWEQRNWPLEALDRLAEAQERGPHALLDRAGRELERLFSSPRRRQARLLQDSELDEARALAAGRAALADLRELARCDRALAPDSAPELARALERVEVYSGAAAAGFSGDAVAVLDPLALRARRVKALFVCGLQEGVFPARARPEPLLSQEERRRLAEVSGLRLGEGEDTLAAERYLLYAAVSRPEERLTLSWHVADDDGEAVARSLFVDDVCDLFDERLQDSRRRRALGAVDGTRAGENGFGGEPAGARAGGGRLRDERLLAELGERVWSASSLERWIGCPVRWYVERLLAPDALEPQPEPLARGSLAHAALRDVLDGLRARTGSARVSEQALPVALALLERALEANEHDHPLSVAPERLAPARRRLRADLERYLRDCAASGSPLEPKELELGFGFGDEEEAQEPGGRAPLPALDLGEGLLLRGRIDRVDVGEDGSAVVYDYKGGKAPPSARWIADGSLQVALYMLAVQQLLRLQAAGGFYQPLSGEDLRARGVLDRDSGLELDCVRTDVRDSSELAELLEQVRAAAHRAAGEAARGELEPRPPTCAFRGGCMYPAICRCER